MAEIMDLWVRDPEEILQKIQLFWKGDESTE